jgi:uncharacterized protein (TIGR02147 family)
MQNDHYYVEVLKDRMEALRSMNSQYSLRAFSKSLNIDASTLSKVFLGKRNLPASSLESVLSRLNLDQEKEKKFINSISKSHQEYAQKEAVPEENIKVISEEQYFTIIANWEFYAVLNLVELDNFEPTFEHISKRLGLDISFSKKIIQTLLDVDLLESCEIKTWKRSFKKITTSNNVNSDALVQSHLSELDLAKTALIKNDISKTGYYSATVQTNQKAIEKAKKLSFKFIEKFIQTLETGKKEEVYQVGIQIFPLTTNPGQNQ